MYPTTECLAASCSCTGGACAQTSESDCSNGSCTAPASTSCGTYACNGTVCYTACTADADCAAGNYCSGGQCVAQATAGQPCTTDDSCVSGACLGSVCCSSPCATAGACGASSCASSTGACVYPTSQCVAASCSAGVATAAAVCANGSCPVPTTTPCGAYNCRGTTCGTTCTHNAQCSTGNACNASGQCVPQIGAGQACTLNSQCPSAQCLGGFCCASTCLTNGGCGALACVDGSGACIYPGAGCVADSVCQSGTCSCDDPNESPCQNLGYCSLDQACTCPPGGGCACTVEPTTCSATPAPGTCGSLDPSISWEASYDGVNFTAQSLPDTGDIPDFSIKYYSATLCGQPRSVYFRWASDNDGQLLINGTVAFDQFWGATNGQGAGAYCSNELCCGYCCDNEADCQNAIENNTQTPAGWYQLGAGELSLFAAGSNTVTWQVYQATGGSGFYGEMVVNY